MSPSATYDTAHPSATGFGTAKSRPQLCKMDASDPNTTPEAIIEVIERDGGLIVQNLITHDLAQTIKAELKPYFDNDVKDPSGFFPATTQRATGLVGISPACVDYLTTPLLIDVANKLLTSKFTYFLGEKPVTVESKPQISSTVGFRVNPGGTAQALHRDDADYHGRLEDQPIMIGCIVGISRATAENGATQVIPGSHKWGPERAPKVEEAIAAELETGDALIFSGHMYHGGGANITRDEVREIVGLFLTKGFYRQAENQYLMVPPELARVQSPQVQRLLGYGISRPSCGFYKYQDPMRAMFGVEDEETVDM
ncbi:hypothetical protein B0A52_04103 [Exophiala mesophila]|uniref:Phytanoyl-CoA dioxygenase n=1 Tax=Exophiala mesophila TaxID=212818 RepID=A0A438NAN3_EXOME|nr:hypothetical protein B0A52_04103 [Exophiala mesophila]